MSLKSSNSFSWKILFFIVTPLILVSGIVGFLVMNSKIGTSEVCNDTTTSANSDSEAVTTSSTTENYRHVENINDSEGTLVGYGINTLSLNPERNTYELTTQQCAGEGIVVTGTYVQTGDNIVLSYDQDEFWYVGVSHVTFHVIDNVLGNLTYTGDNFGTCGIKTNDFFQRY